MSLSHAAYQEVQDKFIHRNPSSQPIKKVKQALWSFCELHRLSWIVSGLLTWVTELSGLTGLLNCDCQLYYNRFQLGWHTNHTDEHYLPYKFSLTWLCNCVVEMDCWTGDRGVITGHYCRVIERWKVSTWWRTDRHLTLTDSNRMCRYKLNSFSIRLFLK